VTATLLLALIANDPGQAKRSSDLSEKFADFSGQIDAISKAQAVIEFNMDGTIITANDNFLNALGYTLDEIQGQHHSIFVEPAFKVSTEYQQFWKRLNQGEFEAKEYKRIGKGGKEVWIQASYNPILDENGKPFKVVKYATDVSEQKQRYADFAGQINAISKAQAVIEFNMDGTIITANDNFLNALGYNLSEVQGQHHSMFVEPAFKASAEYQQFWAQLNRGEYEAKEYKRIGKGGKEVWIQASYNPIMDLNEKPFKVVKYATDVSEQKAFQTMIENVLNETSRVMESLSQGDLTQQMAGVFTGQFAQLQSAVNDSLNNLLQVVTKIGGVAESVNAGSAEISQGNVNLSQRTEDQASSLEETASSMEEMTSTVKQNADNARQANQLAIAARDQAEVGGTVVKGAIVAMEEINTSSKKIADIIGVIDEIAFQTNLLVLNASVEAARAGDQGRGFAVVASEVRNLAGRSATAAKEIKDLIQDSGSKVEEGSRLVNKSGETLTEIVDGIKKVTDIVGEIAAASAEQSTGIEEVNKAITQMDEMTQQNAALVEEAASASESLSDQADNLGKLIAYFTTGDATGSDGLSPKVHHAHTDTERRSAKRPWSDSKQAESVKKATPTADSKKAAAVGGAKQDWEEF